MNVLSLSAQHATPVHPPAIRLSNLRSAKKRHVDDRLLYVGTLVPAVFGWAVMQWLS